MGVSKAYKKGVSVKGKRAVSQKAVEPVEAVESESSESEESSEEEEEFNGFSDDEGEHSEHKVTQLASSSSSKVAGSKGASAGGRESGVVYIGRLPDGFEEAELSKYFKQFGDISNLVLIRNKKTGHSKHFGFVEFKSLEDAKVAQETMNNYLMLNHQLKVELVENNLFKQPKNKRFKQPFKSKQARRATGLQTAEQVQAANKRLAEKRARRKNALKLAGFSV